jgi:hypothetical protein
MRTIGRVCVAKSLGSPLFDRANSAIRVARSERSRLSKARPCHERQPASPSRPVPSCPTPPWRPGHVPRPRLRCGRNRHEHRPHPVAAVPRLRHARGGSGILLDDELARAVRCESALAIRYWWGVGGGRVPGVGALPGDAHCAGEITDPAAPAGHEAAPPAGGRVAGGNAHDREGTTGRADAAAERCHPRPRPLLVGRTTP